MRRKRRTNVATKVILLLLLFGSSPVLAQTKQQCIESDLSVCIYNIVDDSAVRLFAINRHSYDVTIGIDFELSNMRPVSVADTFVVEAVSTKQLSSLQVIDRNQPSDFHYAYTSIQGSIEAVHDNLIQYQLPYAIGSTYYVGQSCDTRGTHQADHVKYAIDFSLPVGTAVHAIRGGKVIALYELSNSGGMSTLHFDTGNFLQIEHDDGTIANYHHLRMMGVKVTIGDVIQTGDFIAYSGDTGFSSGPHLHVSVQKPESTTTIQSIPIQWYANRGAISCPRAGLALKAVAAPMSKPAN